MRKIIITLIATIVLIAPFEKVTAQSLGSTNSEIVYANFPTVNILTGVNTRLSLGFWQFEFFFQAGLYGQIFEERITIETTRTETWWSEYSSVWQSGFYLPRFVLMEIFNAGIKFRVTDRDCIVFGVRARMEELNVRNIPGWWYFYLGYIRRENLSQRMNVELRALLNPGWSRLRDLGALWCFESGVGIVYGIVNLGVALNYEIFNNFNLAMQLGYSRKFSVVHHRNSLPITLDNVFTRNIVDFSIGIHYHIPLVGWQPQQPIPPRPPRQRVTPHQRALPCPPGQMRHLRSWDRPSSVFNHPSGR